jgi:zinc transport system ATP-binding protein
MTARSAASRREGPDRNASAAEETLVRGAAVGVVRRGTPILTGVDIDIRRGEIVSLVGPNGAGKTTLARVLLGLVQPTSGSIWRHPRMRTGYVPQRFTVDAVLPLPVIRLMTLTRRIARPAALAALAETGVGHLGDAQVQTLSGGELQRVLLARTLVGDPDLLVLDEPAQGVDFAGEAALYELINDIRRRRSCGILMVSHDIHLVMAATDRVICLNRHICCEGAPETVGRHPVYVRLFGSRAAAAALALYPHHHDHEHALSGAIVAPPSAGAGRVTTEPHGHAQHGHGQHGHGQHGHGQHGHDR